MMQLRFLRSQKQTKSINSRWEENNKEIRTDINELETNNIKQCKESVKQTVVSLKVLKY
jgi:hypothetical protein